MTDELESNRRRFLRTGAVAAGAVALSGCIGSLTGGGADMSIGETQEREIESDDPRDPKYDDLAEPVTFEGEAGTTVVITMTSEEFDTYLVVEGPDGNVVAENDDGASGLNSQLQMTLEQSGTYTVWAGSFSGEATGPYTLTIEEA